jgi:hypothetical protein
MNYHQLESRIERVLTMVHNNQNYWVCGVCPSAGVLKTIEHNNNKKKVRGP